MELSGVHTTVAPRQVPPYTKIPGSSPGLNILSCFHQIHELFTHLCDGWSLGVATIIRNMCKRYDDPVPKMLK